MENAFKKNIIQRIPSALMLAGLLIIFLITQSIYLINAVVYLLGMLLVTEWYRNSHKNYWPGVGILSFILIGILMFPHILVFNIFLIGIFWLAILFLIPILKPSQQSIFSFNNIVLCQFLVVGFISGIMFIFLEHNELGVNKFLFLFLLIFQTAMVDVFAYIVGSNFGKTSIIPLISPNKTLEGFLGGFLMAAFLTAVIAFFLSLPFKIIVTLILLIPFAFAGDLLESLIKRSSNLKDSGSLLPGHGGLWDRLDSHIAVLSVLPIVLILSFNLI